MLAFLRCSSTGNFKKIVYTSYLFYLKQETNQIVLDVSNCPSIVLLRTTVVPAWVRRHELQFPHQVWVVADLLMQHIAFCSLGYLEISSNGLHTWFALIMFLHPIYELWSPDTDQRPWRLFALSYRRHIPAGGFQSQPNFVHKRSGSFQNTFNRNNALLCVQRKNHNISFYIMFSW